MRPLRLSMTAFGPYDDTQSIDFSLLADRSFFLIHGPTGAGKTTILDAICFALYGESSGDARKSEQMRSHHSKKSTITEVSFDFMLGPEIYRVKRSLKREHSQNSEAEVTYKVDKAGLWKRTGVQNNDEMGTVLASKWTKVTEAIENLFGFESKQFRQVILLPQDQFQKLLMATSQAREDLFKVLFQTEQFECVEKALKEEAKRITDVLTELGDKRSLILDMAQVARPDELAEKRKAVEVELQGMQSELGTLRSREQGALRALEQGKDDQRKIDERDHAIKHLETMEAKQTQFDARRQQLKRAQRAAELVELENIAELQSTDANKVEHRQREAEIDLARIETIQQQAANALEQEIDRETERVAARREQDRLETLKGQVQELELARVELERELDQVKQATNKLDDVQVRRDGLQKQLEQLEQSLGKRDAVTRLLISAQQAEIEAKQVHERWHRLYSIAKQWKSAQEKEAQAQKYYQQTEDDFARALETRNKLEEAWHNSQAAILAAKLVDNTPCPVCGSTHHPNPAASSQIMPAEAELQKAQELVVNLEAQKQVAQTKWLQLRDDTVKLDADRKPLIELLGDKAHLKSSQIEYELKMAQNALQEARENDELLTALQQQLQPLKNEFRGSQADFDVMQNALQDALSRQATAQAIFSEREQNVPTELSNKEKLKRALEDAEAKVIQLDQALRGAQSAHQKAKEDLARTEATLKQVTEQAILARQKANELGQQFIERLRMADFTDKRDYLDAKLDTEDIALLDKGIRDFDVQLEAARERSTNTIEAARSSIKPDLAGLEEDSKEARRQVDATLQSLENLRLQVENYEKSLQQLAEVQESWEKQNKQFSIIGKIAEIANGKNAFNITFHRFVLSALLDDVLSDATQRLKIMSRGRYILQRSESVQDKRKGGGLDMVISDTWTGESKRPVGTLSGGESFYTSLALALGLADVVQRYAGGIRLDTIFVDEGFGSLDTDTLDLAIRTLEGLKEDGRLVGIISHVESLRERIPACLQVTRGTNGSAVKLIIGR